jgi:hypothetical protein
MSRIRLAIGSDAVVVDKCVLSVSANIGNGGHADLTGLANGPTVAALDARAVVALLQSQHVQLAQLTRPDGVPVWVQSSQVVMVRRPVTEAGNAVVGLGGFVEVAIRESVEQAQSILGVS